MLAAMNKIREFAKTDVIELRVGIHFGDFVGGFVSFAHTASGIQTRLPPAETKKNKIFAGFQHNV